MTKGNSRFFDILKKGVMLSFLLLFILFTAIYGANLWKIRNNTTYISTHVEGYLNHTHEALLSLNQYLSSEDKKAPSNIISFTQHIVPELREVSFIISGERNAEYITLSYIREGFDKEVHEEEFVETIKSSLSVSSAQTQILNGLGQLLERDGISLPSSAIAIPVSYKASSDKNSFLIAILDLNALLAEDKKGNTYEGISSLSLKFPEEDKIVSSDSSYKKEGVLDNLILKSAIELWNGKAVIEFFIDPKPKDSLKSAFPFIIFFVMVSFTLFYAVFVYRREHGDKTIYDEYEYGSDRLEATPINRLSYSYGAKNKLGTDRECREIIKAVSDVIFEVDEKGVLVFLNPAWEDLTGQSIETSLGNSIFNWISPEYRDEQKELFAKLIKGKGGIYSNQISILYQNGIKRQIRLSIHMMHKAENNSLNVVGIIENIEGKAQASRILEDVHKQYKLLFNKTSEVGTYKLSCVGDLIEVDKGYANILGYNSIDECLGDLEKPPYVDDHEGEALMQNLEIVPDLVGRISEVNINNGKRKWLLENIHAVQGKNRKAQFYEVEVWDITMHYNLKEVLEDKQKEIDTVKDIQGVFLSNMGHELRTPLNAIIGFSEIIKQETMGKIDEPSYVEYAANIYDGGNKLLKIINDMVEFSRIKSGNRLLNEVPFKIYDITQSCLSILSSQLEAYDIELYLKIPPELPAIYGDDIAFKQVIMSVLQNSIKYTEQGGRVTIRAYILRKGGDMIIEIEDNGVGMTEEDLEKAKTPFGQAGEMCNRGEAGTGLGMNIAEGLIYLHGGEFNIQSRKGKGTVISITIPAERVAHEQEEELAS